MLVTALVLAQLQPPRPSPGASKVEAAWDERHVSSQHALSVQAQAALRDESGGVFLAWDTIQSTSDAAAPIRAQSATDSVLDPRSRKLRRHALVHPQLQRADCDRSGYNR